MLEVWRSDAAARESRGRTTTEVEPMTAQAQGLGRVAGYVYRDDAYCPDCIVEACFPRGIRSGLRAGDEIEDWMNRWADYNGIDRDRPWSFSNHVFPDRLYAQQVDMGWVCETCRKEIR